MKMEILYEEPGNGYTGLSWEPTLEKWILHLVTKEWSLSTYKRYKKLAKQIKHRLRQRGITEIYGLSDTEKEIKFNRLFGGVYTGTIVKTDDGELKYLVKCKL
jgi:hypothetical protein